MRSTTDRSSPPSPEPFNMPFRPGDVVGGKYEIQRLIGVGCIGFVVAARRTDLGDEVALKFLRPEYSAERDLVQRFAREARFTARIKSEHVARVFDVGSLADGAPYIVMERLEGDDLRSHVIETGPLSTEVAVDFVLQACEALAGAHANSIIHRDIKPENLFLTRLVDGTSVIKVLDFGVSKLALTGIAHKTVPLVDTIAPVGSPLYMSPEQVRTSADVDARSDIWALGCVLYELLAATPAFDAPSLMQICAMILEESPPSLRSVSPSVPDGLEEVVFRCLQKDPSARFQDVSELALALSAFAPEHARGMAERCRHLLKSAPGETPSGLDAARLSSDGSNGGVAISVRSAELDTPAVAPPAFRPARARWVMVLSLGAGVIAGVYAVGKLWTAGAPKALSPAVNVSVPAVVERPSPPPPPTAAQVFAPPETSTAPPPSASADRKPRTMPLPAAKSVPSKQRPSPPPPVRPAETTESEPDVGF